MGGGNAAGVAYHPANLPKEALMSCAACGTENPAEARFCLACGAALTASASPAHLVAGLRVARLGDRLLAVILDTALLAAAFALAGSWVAKRWGGLTASGFEMTGAPALLTIGVVAALGFLYYWFFEGLFSATIGKAIVGVGVCDVAGRDCGMKRSLVRNLLRLIDGFAIYLVGFLVAALSRLRQRLGDHLAGTYVVEKGVGGLWRALLILVWLASITGALWGAFVIHRSGATATTLAPPPVDATRVATVPSATPALPPAVILASGDLKLSDFAFLQGTDGPPRAPGPFKPRERLYASFKATGLSTDAQGQIHLRYGVLAHDANGLVIQKLTKELDGPPGASNTATVSVWFDIPLFVPPGTARLRVMAHDNVKNTDGEIVVPFVVDAPTAVSSSQLEIRDLHFSLSEDGPPLDPAVISSGSTLYVEGKLAGMQFRGEQVDVGIAFQVLDPGGSTIVDKPDFLEIKDSYLYHPPSFYVPITAHLSLPSGAQKGTYREKYLVTDRVGGTTRTYEMAFKLQ